jgi:hypothetical protein
MAYQTSIALPSLTVLHKDIVVTVQDGSGRVGRLKISKGGAVWVPSNGQKGYLLRWNKIDALFQEFGRKGDYPI